MKRTLTVLSMVACGAMMFSGVVVAAPSATIQTVQFVAAPSDPGFQFPGLVNEGDQPQLWMNGIQITNYLILGEVYPYTGSGIKIVYGHNAAVAPCLVINPNVNPLIFDLSVNVDDILLCVQEQKPAQ